MITKGFGEDNNVVTKGLGYVNILISTWRDIIKFAVYIKTAINFNKEL